jgi:hypothetical protein
MAIVIALVLTRYLVSEPDGGAVPNHIAHN